MTNLSGWCAPAFGLPHTKLQHRDCRSAVCGCEDFGGHVRNAQSPAVERDSMLTTVAFDGGEWDNIPTTSTANEVARATAAKRSPGPTITDLGVTA